ncbi:MAG TPA: HAD-IC family P-type ATPase, partial [Candidatus Coprousia avicola]|nr:HAD-IC family P-type ATPase [Candidatus Coprousia avicola]
MGSRFGASHPEHRDASTAPRESAAGRDDRREDADPLDTIRKQTIDQVLSELGSSRGGLASEEACSRQQTAGKNLIESAKKRSPLLAFLSNFTHLMAVLLWVAGSIAFLAGMPELGVAVWLVNIINGVFSFWQEHRASQATEALKKMLPAWVTVIRDGQEQKILAEDLVPGDVMLLAEGDKISADARVIQSSDLQVNQSTLNGESTPSRKTADAVLEEGLSAAEIPNLVFAGTSVSEGNGRAVVFRIGMATEFGKIASLTQNMEAAESPLTRELNRLTKQVTVFAMCMGIAFFLLSMLVVKEPFANSFIFALGMVVAFIPEGLLPTVTLSLAMAVQRMSTRNALVKKLDSVEALGSTSVICTDKTGTLTQNEMTVNHLWTSTREYEVGGVGYAPQGTIEAEGRSWRAVDDADLELLLEGGLLCGNARLAAPETEGGRWEVYGDPTEACLIVSAAKGGIDRAELEERMPRIKELPFESRRKRMTTVHALEQPIDGARRLAFVKGAPNEVVRLSTKVRRDGRTVELDEATRARIMAANDAYAADGLRVLAVAYRPLDGACADADIPASLSDYDPDTIERNLTFVGLEVMMDPPRPEVAAAVAECRRAGIRIVMITGDYGLTAASIARRLKIVEGDGVSVISGFELAHMDDEELKRRLAGQVVFARMAPEQKLRVVTALQEMGEIVAVTGDGVNDAPA